MNRWYGRVVMRWTQDLLSQDGVGSNPTTSICSSIIMLDVWGSNVWA